MINIELNTLKLTIATVCGLFAAWFGRVWELLALVLAAIILDYLTGLLAGRANEGINSRRATQGLYKKVGFLCLLVLGFFLDVAFNHFITRGFSFQMPFELHVGLIISVWIVVTEAYVLLEI